MSDQQSNNVQCRGRVPVNHRDMELMPENRYRDLGQLDARLDSFHPATEEVVLRLDAWQCLEFWAEPRFSLAQLRDFLREEAGLELQWRPINGTMFESEVISRMK